jgi:predicted enzyme related to lactoylglutathione lyase
MIKEIAFTGTPVTDMQRARAFYEGVLGLAPGEEMAGGKWVEYQVGGGTYALTNIAAERWTPSDQGTAVAFEVDDLDELVENVRQSGAKFFLEKSESPVCWMAIAHDPDGNKVVLHKRKASA